MKSLKTLKVKLQNKSVPKSGTLGILECVVRRLKALQHIIF